MRGRDSISGRFAPVRRRGTRSTTGTAVRDDATPVSHPPAASERAAGQSQMQACAMKVARKPSALYQGNRNARAADEGTCTRPHTPKGVRLPLSKF
jgi:hypothetical protein